MENDGDLDLFVCCYVDWSRRDRPRPGLPARRDRQGAGLRPADRLQRVVLHCSSATTAAGSSTSARRRASRSATPDLKVPVAKSLGRRPLRRRRRRPGRPRRRQRHGAELLLPQPRRRQVRGDRHDHRASPSTRPGSTRGAMGIDWADFKNDGSLGLAIGNFANEMTALYVTDDPESAAVLRPGQHLRPRRPDPAAAEVRPLLLRLRPRRPARPALGQRPPGERHRQGPGDARPTPSRPSSSGTPGKPAAQLFALVGPSPRPAPTCSGRSSAGAAPTPTSTATATSTSSSPPTAAPPASSATTAATGTTGSGST